MANRPTTDRNRKAASKRATAPPLDLGAARLESLERQSAELMRLKAKLWRAPGQTSAKALADLGVTRRKPGRREWTPQELEDLIGFYVNMTTSPPVDAPRRRRLENFDLMLDHVADCHEAAARGGPAPALPEAALFYPDRPLPMPADDALRNVAVYLGVAERTAWDLLRRADRHLAAQGWLDRIGGALLLPRRPAR